MKMIIEIVLPKIQVVLFIFYRNLIFDHYQCQTELILDSIYFNNVSTLIQLSLQVHTVISTFGIGYRSSIKQLTYCNARVLHVKWQT